MLASEIYQRLVNYPNFLGVFARDTLPQSVNYPCALISNTDLSYESGTHWIAIYIDEDGIGEYFDSYGLSPIYQEFRHFLRRNCTNGSYFENCVTLQCLTCVTCGEYCIAYLMTRLNGGTYADFIYLFTSNVYDNDYLIRLYNYIFM